MAKLPFVDPKTAPDAVRETFENIPVDLNIFKMLAHAETCFRPALGLGSAILATQQLDAKLRELVILEVAALSGGRYEWIQHVPIAKATGAVDAEIEAIEQRHHDDPALGAPERAILKFACEVAENVRASDASFTAMQDHFSAREIVETIITVGFYMMMARLTETTDTDLDEPAGTAVLDSASRDQS